jgi:DNA-binding transcriptional LysR family regulator
MLDPVTLDQLRTLLTVADTGNFSAAARKLRRVQSAVSTSMANLEGQLGVSIWDRSTKIAVLTEQGRAVLARARRVVAEMDALRAFTSQLTKGVEARVSVCVDTLFPVAALADGCAAFTVKFPEVDLHVDTQTMSAVSERVSSGNAKLGIVSPLGVRTGLATRALAASIRMIPVAARSHPLSAIRGPISEADLMAAVQIVLAERDAEGVPDQAVLSPRTWRVADLATKHALLVRGLGWGNLPEPLAVEDLARGTLVRLRPVAWAEGQHTLNFFAVHRPGERLGPAHEWLLADLDKQCASLAPDPKRNRGPRARRGPR